MKNKYSTAEIISWEEHRNEAYKRDAQNKNYKFNKETFDLGTEWSLAGNLLEDARPEIKDDKNFVRGFNRGERLKKIAELDSAPKTR